MHPLPNYIDGQWLPSEHGAEIAVTDPATGLETALVAAASKAQVVKACAEQGVLLSAWSASRIRAVTHMDVSAEQVTRAAEVLAKALVSV